MSFTFKCFFFPLSFRFIADASSADCGSSPFLQPTSSVEFCFITVQSMELLSLAHYNFIQNGTLKIRFMSKIAPLARKPMASLTSSDGFLVAEYSWLIPDIENKLERFDYSGRKVKSFASHKFYTGPQGKLFFFFAFFCQTCGSYFFTGLLI